MPFDVVSFDLAFQLDPEVRILDRLPVGGLPAARLPLREPLGDSVANVLGVRVEVNVAAPLQCSQSPDRRGHLHAIVCGVNLAAPEFAAVIARDEQRAPASGPGVAATCAV